MSGSVSEDEANVVIKASMEDLEDFAIMELQSYKEMERLQRSVEDSAMKVEILFSDNVHLRLEKVRLQRKVEDMEKILKNHVKMKWNKKLGKSKLPIDFNDGDGFYSSAVSACVRNSQRERLRHSNKVKKTNLKEKPSAAKRKTQIAKRPALINIADDEKEIETVEKMYMVESIMGKDNVDLQLQQSRKIYYFVCYVLVISAFMIIFILIWFNTIS